MSEPLEQSKFRVPVLMYHYLGVPEDDSDKPYYVTGSCFEQQMRFLWLQGYRSINMENLVAACRHGKALPDKPFVITFDDGHRSFQNIAAPILDKYKFSATMFLITSRIGKTDYLDWSEIENLSARNMVFESHGIKHSILTKIPPDDAKTEIFKSKDILEERLGRKICGYAYRGGHFNEEIKRLVREAGYHYAVCSRQGLNGIDADLLELRRRSIKQSDNIFSLWKKVSPDGARMSVKGLLGYYLGRGRNAA